jgi:hypothetical protein
MYPAFEDDECSCAGCRRGEPHGAVTIPVRIAGSQSRENQPAREEARRAREAEFCADGNYEPQAFFRAKLATWDVEDQVLDRLIDAGLGGDLLEVERLAQWAGIELRTVRRAETWIHRARQVQGQWEAEDRILDQKIEEGLRLREASARLRWRG